jgi:hypothetical protein
MQAPTIIPLSSSTELSLLTITTIVSPTADEVAVKPVTIAIAAGMLSVPVRKFRLSGSRQVSTIGPRQRSRTNRINRFRHRKANRTIMTTTTATMMKRGSAIAAPTLVANEVLKTYYDLKNNFLIFSIFAFLFFILMIMYVQIH